MNRDSFEIAYAVWRLHLWSNNVGSYEDIERLVFDEKVLKIGQCPTQGCDCKYEKVEATQWKCN